MFAELLRELLGVPLFGALGGLVLLILFFAMFLSGLIEFLKSKGHIQPGQAGRWNTALSAVVTTLTFVALNVFELAPGELDEAGEIAAALLAIITGSFFQAATTKAAYLLALFIGLFKRKE